MTDVSLTDTNVPSRRDLFRRLDGMAMSADAKALMGTLLNTTAEVAGKIVEVGRQIVAFVFDVLKPLQHRWERL